LFTKRSHAQIAAMSLLPPACEPVPFDEVAAVLERAVTRLPGGPAVLIGASSRHLAAALHAAGYLIVRNPPEGQGSL
jgi:hypothetical protein